jgi:hypothetical protein
MKSCHEISQSYGQEKALTEVSHTNTTADTTTTSFVDACNELIELGIRFVPSNLCEKHDNVESMERAIEIVVHGQQALKTMQEYLKKAREEPVWVAPFHHDWHGPGWVQYCDTGTIDWIDYFKKQCQLGKYRYHCDLSTTRCCVGCLLMRAKYVVAPLLLFSDAVLNNKKPDVSDLSEEVSIMLGEAIAYAKGENTVFDGSEDGSEELNE